MTSFRCTWSPDNFEAYALITGEPPGPFVVVNGKGDCPTSGYSVHLDEVKRDADKLHLRLVEDPPSGNVLQTITETTVTEFRASSCEAKAVDIEGVGTIRVAQPTDP